MSWFAFIPGSNMIESAHGIVLRARRFAETSLIVNWLTPACGRLSTIAKGALRPKSPFRGKLDLFYEADISFARSRRSELHTLREVSVIDVHGPLRHELGYLRQAAYGAALIEQITETETPLPAIFGLMRGFLEAVPLTAPQPQAVFAWELKLLNELGLKPDLRRSPLTPGTRQIAAALTSNEWTMVGRLKLSEAQATELRQFLQGFMAFHLGRIPKGRSAVLQ